MLSLSSLFGDDASILRERNFQALLSASLVPVLGTALVSPILDSLIGPFGATSTNIGLVISAFTAPAIVMTPILGALADRYSRKSILVVAISIFGIAGTAIAFTTDYRVVLGLRFIQGIGFAGTNPVIITSIGDLYTEEREATGQGIRFMVSGLSGAFFPLISGLLMLFAWQFPFILYMGSLPIAISVYFWFDAREPRKSPAISGFSFVSYTSSLFRLMTHRRVLLVVLVRSLSSSVWIGFLTYNSLIVVRLLGETPVEAGLLATVGFVVLGFSASQAGRVTTYLERRLTLLVLANILYGFGFIIVLFSPGINLATLGVTILAIGFGIIGALYRSIITNLSPSNLRAGLVSLSEAGGQLTATVTPFVMGAIVAIESPSIGFAPALRLAGICVASVGAIGSILCLIIASSLPEVSIDRR